MPVGIAVLTVSDTRSLTDDKSGQTLADRIVILEKGVIQQIGTPTEVFNRPRNLFVAGFIGSPVMNFFNGTLASAEAVDLPGAGIRVALPKPVSGAVASDLSSPSRL